MTTRVCQAATAVFILLLQPVEAVQTQTPGHDLVGAYSTSRRLALAPGAQPGRFAEIEVMLDEAVSLPALQALPQAPGAELTVLEHPARALLEVPAGTVAALQRKGAAVRVIREFVLITSAGTAQQAPSGSARTDCVGENVTNVPIPDGGGWVYSAININCAPAGATVTRVDVRFVIKHPWVGDLIIDLTVQDLLPEYHLWNDPFAGDSDLDITELNILAFNGEPVNQTWLLWAWDDVPQDFGYIDYWWIKVYYTAGGGAPDLIVQSSSVSPLTDVVPGDPMSLSDTTLNQGTAATDFLFYVTWFISLDNTVTTGDFEWAWREVPCCLAPDETTSGAGNVPWPDQAPFNTLGQTYYVAAVADDTALIPESNEGNNWGQVWAVTLGHPPCCTADFGAGDRVRLIVDNPGGAPNLPEGLCGTVVCCDAVDPELPILVSWDGWTQGHNDDNPCDEPAPPYPPDSAWWMRCIEMVPDPGCSCAAPPAPAGPSPGDGATQVSFTPELCWNPDGRGARLIYGSDDRLEVYEVSDPGLLDAADATVAMIDVGDLTDNGNGTFSLPAHPTFTEYIENVTGFPLCPSEPFADQPAAANCSGVLLDADILATAGHCITGAADCASAAFVFGFEMLDASTPVLTVPAANVYFCDYIIQRAFAGDGADWAVVRLDRPVTSHQPQTIRCDGAVPDGQPLVMIGHPSGLPTKIAGGATVRDNTPATHFRANVDAYGGNSGSPVLDATTLLVEGLLVRGNADFVLGDGCLESNWCPDTGCLDSPWLWEEVTRATEFAHLVCAQKVEYDVWFGLCAAMSLETTTQETCWTPPPLSPNTTYCWAITARNACGETGASWSFTTAPTFVSAEPEPCAVDAREPSDPDGSIAEDWWSAIYLTFNGSTVGLLPEHFEAETVPAGIPMAISEVLPAGNSAVVRLEGIIPAGEWTCLRHLPSSAEVCSGSLPADAGGDRLASEADLGTLEDCLKAGACDPWECDIDRRGVCTTADLARAVDLLNGAGVYDPWFDETLIACPSGP